MSDAQDRAKKEYYRARADNIKSQVSIPEVLDYYSIPIRTERAEVQFPCPLHGDGRDDGYSARAYPDEDGNGSHTYCWGCQKARDVIEWVKDKESVSFTQAMRLIEDVFDVKNIPNIYEFFDPNSVENAEIDETPRFEKELNEILEGKEVDPTDFSFIEKKIDRLVTENHDKLALKSATRLYYAYDSVCFDLKEGNLKGSEATKIMGKLITKIKALAQK